MRGPAYSGRVFVLGAGASAFAGYPLANDLLSFIKSLHQERGFTPDAESIARVLYTLDHATSQLKKETRKDYNLETLLTHLDIYGTVGKLRIFAPEWTESSRNKLSNTIADLFQWYQLTINHRVWGVEQSESAIPHNADLQLISRVWGAWAGSFAEGDAIVTFNWDLLHESALWRHKKWRPLTGYGFDYAEPDDKSQVVIYKLHGSVNWYLEKPSEEVPKLYLPLIFPGAESGAWLSVPGPGSGFPLVLPTYLKDVSKWRPLVSVWSSARDAICRAKEVWIIGYSLNPIDHLARLLFATEFTNNGRLNEIYLVSPSSGHWPAFCETIGKRLHHIPMSFEDWVLEGQPRRISS